MSHLFEEDNQVYKYDLVYVSASSSEFDKIADLASKSCPNECIISIERVVNPVLEARYNKRKEYLMSTYKTVTEREVFHGARHVGSAIPNILQFGFKANRNTVSAHGKGTYLAEAYAYSKNYSGKGSNKDYKVMLVNKMCYTKLIKGIPNAYMEQDNIDAGCVWADRVTNPTIYSVPHDEQVLPTYLVQFY
jgi:hypothetical protein